MYTRAIHVAALITGALGLCTRMAACSSSVIRKRNVVVVAPDGWFPHPQDPDTHM